MRLGVVVAAASSEVSPDGLHTPGRYLHGPAPPVPRRRQPRHIRGLARPCRRSSCTRGGQSVEEDKRGVEKVVYRGRRRGSGRKTAWPDRRHPGRGFCRAPSPSSYTYP
uniref:Uncharacterized protein n=1 Tax=Triticum urartu TaxID=4572 RepID=A0A8R7UU79_TRIUA